MHNQRGNGWGERSLNAPELPAAAPLAAFRPRRSTLPLLAATAMFLSGCVSATDPTLMASADAYGPSQPGFSLAPSESVPGADNSEAGAEGSAAFAIADGGEAAGTAAEGSTMTAMVDANGETNIDALNRGITQNGAAAPVANLYSTNQPATQATDIAEAGASAPGVPLPSHAPGREGEQAVAVAALTEPDAPSAATQALEAATDPAPAAAPAASEPARPVALAEPARKKSFFGKLFGADPTPPKAVPAASAKVAAPSNSPPSDETEIVSLRNDIRVARASASDSAPETSDGLPGVRMSSLFEIKAGNDEDGEDAQGVEVASAAGLARLAPNGLHVQTEKVDIACLKPQLVRTLKSIERHYGKPVVVTSGFRSPRHNRKIGGARNSRHTSCEAADIQISGVSKWDLAAYVRSLPGRGGVGTYCHTRSVHVDIGTKRDWNWRCRRRKG
ncbi:D-Ala-D-Ala carboxypeptidase family metallohydrolase [Pseudohoeflea suaedae]|nr:D-Ala-D-Ala carboxypeptidase family metallohydrolase [Pseudohoeflea suaedae]